jgi:hypothetical protein
MCANPFFRLLSRWQIAAIERELGCVPARRGAIMDSNYQFYLLDRQGRTARPPRIMSFRDDQAAMAEARKALSDQTIEIWQGDRCVATLLHLQKAA